MRLGKKKEKDKELEIRSVDGITRLICLSKGQAPLKGIVSIFRNVKDAAVSFFYHERLMKHHDLIDMPFER